MRTAAAISSEQEAALKAVIIQAAGSRMMAEFLTITHVIGARDLCYGDLEFLILLEAVHE